MSGTRSPGHGETAYIGMGANLGDRLVTLSEAIERLTALGVVSAVSSVYETDPVGLLDQPAFLNAVAQLRTSLAPDDLMAALLRIESDLGRVRTVRNAPRTIDLDLLLYDDKVIETAGVVVPHAGLHERAFVLVPLVEIAPHAVHPVLGLTVSGLLDRLGSTGGVRKAAGNLSPP